VTSAFLRPRSFLQRRFDRRRTLAFGLSAAVALAARAGSAQTLPQTAIQSALGEGQKFDPSLVVDLARVLAKRAYTPLANDLPDLFGSLTYEQYVGIRAQPSAVIWAGEGRGFAIEPLHRGFVFSNAVSLFVVEDGVVRRIAYDRSRFDFGKLALPASIGDIGFSGFRVFAATNGDRPQEVAIFQGATFFRAIARGQNFGVLARTLTLRPAETRGEEVPLFRAFWIERPAAGSGTLVFHALIDSESVTGAVRFTLRPGDMTINDVEMTLFARVMLDHIGLGGMTSTFLFGPNDRRGSDDIRQNVYESKGLQIFNGQGEWIWRPLNNPDALQISAFVDANPKGFGLLQRDRDFTAFEDDDQHYERRPSLWNEPLSDWGPGTVQLIEIPTDSDINDNVIAYWRPKQPVQAGVEQSFAFRQFWCWTPPERPNLAIVSQTRVGRGSAGRKRRFAVDFVGDMLAESRVVVEAKPIVWAGPGSVGAVRVWPYPERKTLRVGFELDPGNEAISEMRLVLEAAGKPLSETWLYRWTA
jgi:periplasmic glucans biosynthesis protein